MAPRRSESGAASDKIMTIRQIFNATIRLLLSLTALYIAIVVPDMFDGWGEILANIVLGVIAVLVLVYLWYPDANSTAAVDEP